MNRAEQKERLSEIIDTMEDVISGLKNVKPEYNELVGDFEKIRQKMENEGYDQVLDFYTDEFSNKLSVVMLEHHTDIENLRDLIDSFNDDIESYADEISESRAEKLHDRYMDLEDIIDRLSFSDEDIVLETIIETLEDDLQLIKNMKK